MNHDDKSLGVMSHHRGEKHFRLGVGRNTSEFTKGLRGKKKKAGSFSRSAGLFTMVRSGGRESQIPRTGPCLHPSRPLTSSQRPTRVPAPLPLLLPSPATLFVWAEGSPAGCSERNTIFAGIVPL